MRQSLRLPPLRPAVNVGVCWWYFSVLVPTGEGSRANAQGFDNVALVDHCSVPVISGHLHDCGIFMRGAWVNVFDGVLGVCIIRKSHSGGPFRR